MKIIYSNFVMRLHNESASASTWEIAVNGHGDTWFSNFYLGDVDIPHPVPKTESEDIPGTNGLFDMTEAGGRVFYQNRNITVPLKLRADTAWPSDVDTLLARYNGRVCDFAFNPTYDSVNMTLTASWIYQGRLTATKNKFKNDVILTFDALPFARSTTYTVKNVPTATDLDKAAFGWTFDRAMIGSQTAQNNGANKFEISVSEVGSVLVYKRTGLTAGTTYTLGIKSLVGGSIAFHTAQNGDNLTEGVVDSNGVLEIRITVDGSYYTWQTVDNVVYCYPSFRCEYILANLTPGASFVMLPSNVMIRPEIANGTAAAYLIMDGAVFKIDDTNTRILQPAGAIMPGTRAKKDAVRAKSIFVCVPQTTGTPAMTLGYYEQEAF